MGLFELFELCAEVPQRPIEGGASQAPAGRDDTAGTPMSSAQLLWPAMVSAVLVCLGLLHALAAT